MSTKFQERCYSLLQKLPRGKVTTYKALAQALNSQAYRAVGTAMKNNLSPIKVPCHRVIKSSGEIGNYSQGVAKKIALLKKEGVEIINNKVELSKYLYNFK